MLPSRISDPGRAVLHGRNPTLRGPLHRLRLQRGLSQEQLAVAAGIGLWTLRRLEHGEIYAMTATWLRLAAALGVAATDLMPGLAKRVSKEKP